MRQHGNLSGTMKPKCTSAQRNATRCFTSHHARPRFARSDSREISSLTYSTLPNNPHREPIEPPSASTRSRLTSYIFRRCPSCHGAMRIPVLFPCVFGSVARPITPCDRTCLWPEIFPVRPVRPSDILAAYSRYHVKVTLSQSLIVVCL